MSALWPGSRAKSDIAISNVGPWRPVQIIQIDIDAHSDIAPPSTSSGDRVWIEAVRQGQVVGVLDTRVDDGWPPSDLGDLSARFSEVPLSSYVTVSDDRLSKASIVVPTICENPDELLRTVRSLLALDYPDFEILVVDNRSSDEGTPLPEFFDTRVRTVSERTRGASAARNRGIAISTGEFVAFTDDDAVVDEKWLRVIGARFAVSEEVEAWCYRWNLKRPHNFGLRNITGASVRHFQRQS
jgi:hypothetical protein